MLHHTVPESSRRRPSNGINSGAANQVSGRKLSYSIRNRNNAWKLRPQSDDLKNHAILLELPKYVNYSSYLTHHST